MTLSALKITTNTEKRVARYFGGNTQKHIASSSVRLFNFEKEVGWAVMPNTAMSSIENCRDVDF
ncbi:MAG TPA: hypothetical protein VIZ65_09440 [Cellvibrionaceae bacterium]